MPAPRVGWTRNIGDRQNRHIAAQRAVVAELGERRVPADEFDESTWARWLRPRCRRRGGDHGLDSKRAHRHSSCNRGQDGTLIPFLLVRGMVAGSGRPSGLGCGEDWNRIWR